ncbi:MAG: hypothetical protein JRN37_00680 [Nitrososphaerota archaeon]|jgi:NAD(P)H-flavin reductase|nr:hypothetical protein [Nitrososphaerota archaeon]MDG7040092.1 hypothetical protein [Nitrososphaerota archaeon]
MITTTAKISLLRQVSHNLYLLSVKLDKYREWVPGMFFQLSLEAKTASEPWLDSRAFSFASWGSVDARALVRREGYFTTNLVALAGKGFEGSIKYPLGNFLLNSKRDKVLLAGGAGISVFLSYLDYLNLTDIEPPRVYLFHSSKTEKEGVKYIYWDKMPKNTELYQFITDPVDPAFTGRLNFSKFENIISKLNEFDYFICGPKSFNEYWIYELERRGLTVKAEQWILKEGA